MDRKLKNYGVLTIAALTLATSTAHAKHDSIWDDIVKRLFKKSKVIKLVAGREARPQPKFSPKIVNFKGVVELPSSIYLTSGYGQVSATSGQIVIDGQVVCNYSPKSNSPLFNKIYYLQNCSDGSRFKDEIHVQNKIELRLNHASSDRASLLANVRVIRSEEVEYGLVFPYIQASEGQILMYNGEAWVAADPSELDLQGLQGEQGEPGPMGPQGPAGADGVPGVAGPAGPKGDRGVDGAAGPMGPQGPKGDRGADGAPGVAGPVGPQGLKGADGAPGAVGPMGPQGPVGPMGPKGVDGAPGVAGQVGPQGPQGAVGAMGPKGADGAPGVAGPVGPQGPQGTKGDRGADGAPGVAGPVGPQGPMGLPGAIGPMGPQGEKGEAGPAGPQGPKGEQGEKGEKGDSGASQIAYLRDERVSGTLGGSCTAGEWNPRILNTLGGDTNFIALVNNRFILQPGKYLVEIKAPAHGVNQHQAKLAVLETNQDVLFGTNASSASNAPTTGYSEIVGEIIVAEVSTFEIRHRCFTTRTNNGFGVAANFGSPEIYTQVKITKK